MEFNAAEKYHSMMRAYERLKRITTNNGNSISNTDARDAAEDFFNQCYHLKDWLKKDRITDKQDVERYITKTGCLALAADYCNSFKHGGLDKTSRSGEKIERINTHIKIDFTPGRFVASSQLEITISGKSYDAFKLATDCVKAWGRYLRTNKIVFPPP